MKFLSSISLVALALVQTLVLAQDDIVAPGGVDAAKNLKEYDECKAMAADGVFAVVRYADGFTKYVKYGECVQVSRNGKKASSVVFCQEANCYYSTDEKCSAGLFLLMVLAPVIAPNVVDGASFIGQSAKCYEKDLPQAR